MELELYVDECIGCSHWSRYEFLEVSNQGHLTFKCPICNHILMLTKGDIQDLQQKGVFK